MGHFKEKKNMLKSMNSEAWDPGDPGYLVVF